jgi:hypothetical protein
MFGFSLFKKKEIKKEEIKEIEVEEKEEKIEVEEMDKIGVEKEEIEVEKVEIEEVEEIENAFENQLETINKFVISEHRFLTKIRCKYILWAIEHNIILYNDDNRLINEERLSQFRDFNVNESDPLILGKYYDYESQLYLYDIIDGQHRLEYFKNNELLYNDIEILVDIRVYKSKEDFYKILDIINNRLNFDHKQLRQFKYNEFKNYLETYYKKKIKKSIFGVQRPYVNEEKFKQKLFQTKFFNNIENRDIIIFEKFININQFLSKIIVNENKIKSELKNKFDKIECYISIDKEYIGIELFDVDKDDYLTYWNSKKKKFN